MENKMLALKVYDVDYSFIIKNYLDEKLWQEEWTIFVYKKFKVTLRLDSINVKSKSIWFEVIIDDNNEENKDYFGKRKVDTFKYTLSVNDINILKKQLNHTIFKIMQELESSSYICQTKEWFELNYAQDEEQEKLSDLAKEFLDSENVSNEEIREAYIEYYIDKNEKIYDLKNQYLSDMKYKMITDFYVVFLEATNDTERLELIKQKIGHSELEKTLKEIEKYKEYMQTDEFQNEMKENLEEV